MTPYKWLRLCGTTVSAALVFLLSCACLAGGIGAQSAESAIAGPSPSTAAPSPFLVAPTIPLGYAPSSVATGDLRQSGKFDLVTADYSSGSITVFLGAGKGKFAPGVEYAAGSHPGSVRVADLNGDGRPDVLVANESEGTISVLFGNGDGTFQARQSFKVGFNPSFIATGDFGGSGKVDVAVAGASGNLLAVFLNDGSGNLQKPVMRLLSKPPAAIAAADFNHDSRTDLALANADGTVSILLGKGAGQFRSLADLTVAAGSLSSIESGDLSNSGKIDLIVTEPGRKIVSVLLGKGDGTFTSPVSYSVGNEPVSTLVADINGDDVPALVVINKSSNTFSILSGNGDGSFKPSADFVAGNAPLAAVAGDFYGNGHIDLAIINHSSQTVSVPLGNGDGTFKAARSYSSGVQPMSVASGTLNGGKIPALVVANYCGSDSACGTAGSVSVFLADEKGEYRLSSTYAVGAGPVSVALADLNGDRKMDMVALNRLDKTAMVMLGLGDGTFRQPMTFSLAGSPLAIAVGDLNKDGKLDLAVLEDCGAAKCSQPGSVEVLLGTGEGSFRSVQSYSVGYSPVSVALGDIKGDKNLDLVIANRCGNDSSCHSAGTATVLIGDGTGKFTPGTDVALGNSPSSIALGRLAGSALDLVAARSTDNTVAVLRGNGDGTFKAGVPYAVGKQPGSLVLADFNGDGKPDVAVANVKDSTVSVLFGKGDGTLHPAAALTVGSGPIALSSIGRASTKHAGLATANGSGSAAPGTEFSVLPNLQGGDPPLASFTVVPSPAPDSNVNAMVTLTATLTGVAPNAAPTGTVSFQSDTVDLTDCSNISITQGMAPSLVSTAMCMTQTLTAGSDSISAFYSGDPTYDTGTGETSPSVTQDVSALAATLGVSTPGASNVNAPVTITAQLAGVALAPVHPVGTVDFSANGTTITGCGAQAVDPTGAASCITSALTAPSAAISASYSADPNFTVAAPGTMTQTVNPLTATLGLTSPGASNVNAPVTFTAQLGGVALTPTVPSGTVAFAADGTTITGCGAVTVNAAGTATCPTSALTAAGSPHSITAVYSNDLNFTVAAPANLSQTVNPLTATLGVSSPGAVSVNAPVTFTAQLGGVALTPTVPSGKVAFAADGTTITGCGAVPVNAAGTATCPTSALTAIGSPHSITAVYSNDPNYIEAAPANTSQTVNALVATLGLSSPGASNVNTSVTFTAQLGGVALTPTAPSGKVAFTANGTTITGCGAVPVNAAGTATCPTAALAAPSDAIAATYSGDANFTVAAPASMTQTVNGIAATLGLTSPGASNVNASVTFTAQLAGVALTPVVPSGKVAFAANGTTITGCGAVAVNASGAATCPTNSLVAPSDAISATYSGDPSYIVAAPGTLTQTVNALAASLTLTPSPGPSVPVGTTVTFTAQLAGVALAPTTPSGTVTFTINGASSPDCPPLKVTAGGAATCTTASLVSPADVISASYAGDTNFTVASPATIAESVGKTAPVVTVVSSSPTVSVNQAVTFTATVKPSSGSVLPTGSVTFSNTIGGTVLCSAVSISPTTGIAICPYAFSAAASPGSTVTANYSGDSNFSGLTAATSSAELVTAASTTTALVSAPSPSAVNQSVAFTATVTPAFAGAAKPTGSVVFVDTTTSTTLCTETLSNGIVPVCNKTFTSASSDSIVATYTSADTNFTGSVSNTDVQSVGAGAVSIVLTSLPSPSFVNQPVTFTATISTNSGSTVPQGTMVYTDTSTSTTLCTVTLTVSGNVPACPAAFATAGTHNISAAFTSSNSNFSNGTSNLLSQPVTATSTATSLSSFPSASGVNQSVAFTAVVTPGFGGTAKPAGTVVFTDTSTSTNLCTKTLVAGVVPVCNFTFTSSGTNNVVATYTSADSNFTGSASGVDAQVVGLTPTTTAIVSSVPSAAVNESVTFTATITPNVSGTTNPTGHVEFTSTLGGGAPVVLCASVAVVTNGTLTTAVCPSAFAAGGNYTVTAIYSGDANFGASNASLLQPVGLTTTTTKVVASSPSTTVNQSVTFTATVTPSIPGATNPSGNVAFTYTLGGGLPVTLCANSPVTQATGVATCKVPLPATGSYTVKATYSGDLNFGTSSGTTAQIVSTTSTTTTLAAVPTTSTVDQSVTFTATVTPAIAPFNGSTNPSGTVTFTYTLGGGAPVTICSTVAVSTTAEVTTATCTVPLPTSGSYTVSASYSGDTNFVASLGTALQTVTATPTTTAVAANPNPSSVNQSVTFTATVTSTIAGSTNPTGSVAFSYTVGGGPSIPLCAAVNVSTLGTITTATCMNTLPAQGAYTIKAAYSGDGNFQAGSGVASQTVVGTSTTTAVVSAPSPSLVNQPVTFTATVTPSVLGATNPGGGVAFTYVFNGGSPVTLCASAAVSTAGKVTTATCTAPLPSAGSYTVTAAYSGDTNFGSSSNIVVQNVNPATLSIAVHSSQATSLVNVPVSFTAVLTLPFSATTTPTSTVEFRDTLTGLTLCSNVPVTNLTASCTPALTREWTAATHPVTATYNGDLNFPATTSPVFPQQVIAGASTAVVVSSASTSVATQTVTFTATVIPAQTGPVLPSGSFTFTSTGTWTPAPACQASPVAPITTGTGAGTATATCTVSFPATAESQTISAAYAGDPNFNVSSSSVAETVQNFAIANSVTSALVSSATTGPVTLTQGYSTATGSAAGTDPFNPTKVQLAVTSTGGFTDTLNLNCVVTNASKAVVTDPSCTVAATESGATGTALTYELSASASAPIGSYTATVTADDNANPALSKVTLLTIDVVGVANVLSLAQGASGTENANFNTTTAPPGANLVSFACGIVWDLATKTQLSASQIDGLKCTGPASVKITGASTPASITISTSISTAALFRGNNTISMAAFLGIPLFALMGWVGSRKSPRKNFFRFLGLILLLVGVSYASGCGGSFTSTSKSTNTGIGPGTYLVQVVGTDQNGNKYYAAVPLDVSSN